MGWVSESSRIAPECLRYALAAPCFGLTTHYLLAGCGQDQARSLKAGLLALVPGLRVFLDVDDLDSIDHLERHVGASDVVVVFLAGSIGSDGTEHSDYMLSTNCLRELRCAMAQQKRLVFVRETDAQHGAVSLATHRRDCPEALRHLLQEHPVVPWYRVKAFAQVSLRQVAQVVLDGMLRIPGELLHTPLKVPLLEDAGTFHLYAPTGTHELLALLHSAAPALRVTTNPAERHLARHLLLHLHSTTWSTNDTLQADVAAALADDMPMLLVHEQRAGFGDVPFGTIIDRTPPPLRERGVYSSLAVPLYEGEEFQGVCMRMMLLHLAADVTPTQRQACSWCCFWPFHRASGRLAGGFEHTPALLEMSSIAAQSSKV